MSSERRKSERAEGLHEFTTIGIAGPMGAGKSTAAEILDFKFSLPKFTVSDMLRRLALAQKLKPPFSRTVLNAMYEKLASQMGEAPIVKLSKELISAYNGLKSLAGQPLDGATIDGIRFPQEAMYLKKSPNSFLIVVNADAKTRFDRVLHRERSGDITNWEEFQEKNNREMENLKPIFEIADHVIDNTRDTQDLEQQLVHFIVDKTKLF